MLVPRTRLWLGLAILLAAAVAGFFAAQELSAQRLRTELEERLTELLDGTVEVGELRLAVGLGLRLEGTDVRAWTDGGEAALQIDRVTAWIDPFAHLTGRLRLRRLEIEGARLRIVRGPDGRWAPPLLEAEAEPPDARRRHPDELLSPLIALEGIARFVLTQWLVADTVVVRGGRIELLDAAPLGGGIAAIPHQLVLDGIEGRLRRRLLGAHRLEMRASLLDKEGQRGSLELRGSRSPTGALRLAIAATHLELEALDPYLPAVHPDAHLKGTVSGTVVFRAPSPGTGELEVDLIGYDMRSEVPLAARERLGPLESSRIEISGTLEISPQYVRLDSGTFAGDLLDLQLDGIVQRPLHADSRAQLSLAMRDVTPAQVRHLVGWLPEVEREEAESIVANLENGRLLLLRTGGSATLSDWQAFLAGRTRQLPMAFVLDVVLADTTLRVGESDRIENLNGRLWWAGDRLEVRNVRAQLNGSPLPSLDLTVDGVSHFFAVDPAARELASGALPLVGLRPLWELLRSEPEDSDAPAMQPTVRLEIERLEHPMFLWPIADLQAVVEPLPDGIRIETSGGTWAGVPIHGEAEWLFEPSERVRAHLTAEAPVEPVAAPEASDGWARGHLEVGAISEGRWRHRLARARFSASEGTVFLRDGQILLDPFGRVAASGSLDLTHEDAVPVELSFALTGGDLSSIADWLGLPRALATGQADLFGSFDGSLQPEVRPLNTLNGLLRVEARDGTIRRATPAVVAVALASEVFNPFANHQQVRFDRVETLLEFVDGRMSTDSFTLDGPDVRAFAKGGVDLARPPHEVDAEVALFLFRQVDWVIEKIPILNLLLLGPNENLIAAHFNLSGPWGDPEAKLIPLRSLATGPGSIVFRSVPALVLRGIEAIDSLFSGGRVAEQESPEPPAQSGAES